ncbi:MAG: diguanylate cyclase [Desulfuromonadaceae bacterium]|nr:diguanylate cyclase [Desulfuromonadaceae bacterium]MDD2855058.1 diguanylate cyclase [Desulfuromonadaceae bacterium]
MKILLAEDDKISRRLLERVFSGYGYDVVSASDGDEAWRILEEPEHPHLLVLDWMMPGVTGVEIVKRLRERPDGHTYYAIILTSLDTPDDLAYALDGGADEFVSKPYHADALRARANVGRRIVSLHHTLSEKIRLLQEANATISHLAATDELTTLYNRRYFNENLTKSISAAKRYKFPLSLVMVDIDKFKAVNDTYGHSSGDTVLKAFADILRSLARTEDVSARWGGEEFIILLTHTARDGAAVMAERVRSKMASECLRVTSIPVTVSLGVVEWGDGEDPELLIKRADKALYRAKDEGRNRVVLG